ncbi:MAG: hypothetical protein IK062_10970 [Selenomonadaceae bacterium]|nr:hypothetical protein [Selenomonadaceae bacterium]
MATREENLKKINDELEKMSDEELEKVAGGCIGQTAADSYILSEIGLCPYYSGDTIMWTPGTKIEDRIQCAYASVGIKLEYHSGFADNKYYFNNKSISEEEAWKIAREQAKKLKIGIYSDRRCS